MADVAGGVLGARHEEAGVEAARPARRRHGPRDQVEAIERRPHALVEEAAPVLAKILLGRTALERLGQHQSSLFKGFPHGGNGQSAARCAVAALRRRSSTKRSSGVATGNAGIGAIDAPTGKDIAVGHESVLGVAAAQQHFGTLPRWRTRISVAASRGRM